MENIGTPFTVGHHDSQRSVTAIPEVVALAHAANYDLVTSPITTPHFHSRVLALLSSFLSESSSSSGDEITTSLNASPIQISPLTPADTLLSPDESINQTLGVTSSWIDLGSPDPVVADISRQVLSLELTYAAFCGITYVLIPGPRSRGSGSTGGSVAQFARAVLDGLSQGPYMQLFIWLPMIDHAENQREEMGDLSPFARTQFLKGAESDLKRMDLFGTWQMWDTIRSMCKYSTRVSVALSVPRLLPPSAIQSRWYSEPVRVLTLAANVFTKNPKGYPVLTKAHQALVSRFGQHKQPAAWFILCDVGQIPGFSNGHNTSSEPTPAESVSKPQIKDPSPHLSYMRNLQTKLPAQSPADKFGAGYQDYLQAPLQPLTVHLESITYEVFEKDPIKYEWYERAVARALHDWVEQGKPTSNPDGRVVVAVVGAGRGPLVTRALQASEAVGVEIDMWALEKNPNAFVLLQRHNQTIWDNRVSLVKSDMRTWRGPVRAANVEAIKKTFNVEWDEEEAFSEQTKQEKQFGETPTYTGSIETDQNYLLATATHETTHYKIDILISELLGSFADNELSPECLDGVQHLLNPTHGISIPASYTAHISPVAAPKLHADISLNMTPTMPHAAEIPYVVMLNAIDFLSTIPSAHTQSANSTSPVAPTTSTAEPPTSTTTPILEPTPTIHQTWSFQHPNPQLPQALTSATATSSPSNSHNARHTTLTFPIPHRSTCHGLAGYFETVLYQGVELSTNPLTMDRKSEGMISWFPIFFPLKSPLYIPDDSELIVQMWRQTDDRKVWYEWIVEAYSVVMEAYRDGRTDELKQRRKRFRIGGSELHSSEKEGCLM